MARATNTPANVSINRGSCRRHTNRTISRRPVSRPLLADRYHHRTHSPSNCCKIRKTHLLVGRRQASRRVRTRLAAGGRWIRTLSQCSGLQVFCGFCHPWEAKWTPYWITFGLPPTRINRQPGRGNTIRSPLPTLRGTLRFRGGGFLRRGRVPLNQDFGNAISRRGGSQR